MIAIGVMSGTSADGIDAAAIEIGDGPRPAVRFIAHRATPYPNALRYRIIATASGAPLPVHDLAALHAALGDAYAAAAGALIAELGRPPDCIAVHGQTVAHRPAERATLQIGDAARVAIATGIPVVADFRSADIAAGGEGAPLVPFADHLLFADGTPRVLLNLGGIANLTLLPTARAEDVRALDTGPANMILDQLARKAGTERDEDGAGAARGRVVESALTAALVHPYFARRAPKSTGREDFGNAFVQTLLQNVRREGGTLDDALATATAVAVESIARGLARETPAGVGWRELVVAGGGALNPTLLSRITARVGLPVRRTTDLGIPVEAREAVAFAILGAFRLRGEPNTLPRCTGASRPVSAGAVHRP